MRALRPGNQRSNPTEVRTVRLTVRARCAARRWRICGCGAASPGRGTGGEPADDDAERQAWLAPGMPSVRTPCIMRICHGCLPREMYGLAMYQLVN
jgi:hypothetical protein